MKLIRQNPYHVIGILAGANQRTIARQKTQINAFQKVGKSIEFDTDLLFAGNPDRSEEAIKKAFADIQINQSRLLHALFWLINHNHLDETALNHLQSGDLVKTEVIWQKTTSGKDVTSRNFSAFNNLGTLKIALAFSNGSIDLETLMEGIHLKTKLITSDTFKEFCHWVADETYTVDNDKELENFIKSLLEHTENLNNEEAKQIPSLLGEIHPKLKSFVSEKLTDTPVHNIERKIDQNRKKRNENPENGLKIARELYSTTKNDLSTLFNLLGPSELKYQMVADKFAKELLQCGIDYFQTYKDYEEPLENDLGESVRNIFGTAKRYAVGTQTKERIAENIESLQEWIDNSEERKKQNLISEDLHFINQKLKHFQNLSNTVENADDLVTGCKPKLQNIKNVLGANDDYYLKISSAVVNNALGMLVTVINEAQEDGRLQYGLLQNLKNKILESSTVIEKINKLDMFYETEQRYKNNRTTIKAIANKLGLSLSTTQRTTNFSKNSSKTTYAEEYDQNPNSCLIILLIAVAILVISGILYS